MIKSQLDITPQHQRTFCQSLVKKPTKSCSTDTADISGTRRAYESRYFRQLHH